LKKNKKRTSFDKIYFLASTHEYLPEQIVMQRDKEHHMGKGVYGSYNLKDFGPAKVSVWAASTTIGYGERLNDPSYWAIRGAEQLQINYQTLQGNSANSRAGIYELNKHLYKYLEWGMKLLGF